MRDLLLSSTSLAPPAYSLSLEFNESSRDLERRGGGPPTPEPRESRYLEIVFINMDFYSQKVKI